LEFWIVEDRDCEGPMTNDEARMTKGMTKPQMGNKKAGLSGGCTKVDAELNNAVVATAIGALL